jgi:hypothetical protein
MTAFFTTASVTTLFWILYAAVAGPMLVGLLHGRAAWSRLLLWPLSAAVATALIGAAGGLVSHALAATLTARQTHGLVGATLLLVPLIGYGLGRLAARTTPAYVHQRGTRVIDGHGLQHTTRKRRQTQPDLITLAGIAVEPQDETKHFKLIGTTGSGKSTAIRELLRTALARGDRALIADPDGGYLQRFYDPHRGDVILNPFDPRSARWDLFAELRDPYDADQLARALIPDAAESSGREWRAYARTFLASVLRTHCVGAFPKSAHPTDAGTPRPTPTSPHGSPPSEGARCAGALSKSASSDASGSTSPPSPSSHGATPLDPIAELWRRLAIATAEELRPLVANTPAQPFLEPENARMFGSIRSVTTAALGGLEHVAHQSRGIPFSIRDFVRCAPHLRGGHFPDPLDAAPTNGPSVVLPRMPGATLFMPYAAGQIATLRGLIATWLRLAIFEAMNGSEGDQRLWFVIDELDALGAIDGLKDALARVRKFGGRCVLGFQSIGQVSALYGRGDAQTLVENCGNTLILRCSASEGGGTAQFASQLIGQREVLRRHVSRTDARDGTSVLARRRRSTTESDQVIIEPAVLPAEIEQLPDLAGYAKTASVSSWYRVNFRSDLDP